jgi:hypothetical protein
MTPSVPPVVTQTLQNVAELSHCKIGIALIGLLIDIGLVKEIEPQVIPLRGS